mgnify:CR=1 FL=1
MNNLKALRITIPLLAFAVTGIFLIESPESREENTLKISNKAARTAWLKERIVDPATGEVPHGIRNKELAFAKTIPSAINSASRNEGRDSLDFVRRGPDNVGGRTRALAIDKTNAARLFAGGVSGGLWKSEDFAGTWKRVTSTSQALSVTCIAQDVRAGKESTWYIGTGEGRGSINVGSDGVQMYGEGMFKSTDKGQTWVQLSETVLEKVAEPNYWGVIWNVAVDASNLSQDEVYVAANGAIMKSIDGGNTWTQTLGSTNSSNVHYTDVKVTSTGIVYAAIGKSFGQLAPGIYRSTDGDNWVNITGQTWPSNYERIVFDFSQSRENEIYFLARTPGSGAASDPGSAATEYNSLFKYNYRSGDGSGLGGTWNNLSSNIPSDNNAYYTFDSQGNYNMMIKVDPFNADYVYIGGTNLFRSSNGFLNSNNTVQIGGYNPANPLPSVREYRYPNHHPDQHNLVFQLNNPSEAFSASDGGISKTQNLRAAKVDWTFANKGYYTSQFYTVAIDHVTKNDVVVGGLQDNGTQFTNSSNVSKGWTDPMLSDGSYCYVEDNTSSAGVGYYYMSSQFGRTIKASINGSGENIASARLEQQVTDQTNRSVNYDFINPFVVDYSNNNIMYMQYKDAANGPAKIRKFSNLNGVVLNNSNSPRFDWSTIPFAFPGRISAMVCSRKNPEHRLYIGTTLGKMYRVEKANEASPVTTELAAISGVIVGRYVSDFAIHPDDADKIMVTFSNYNAYSIFYSEDGGDSWQPIAGNLEDELPDGFPATALGVGNGPSVRCAAIISTADGDGYFVGTSTGLYGTDSLAGLDTKWTHQSPDLIGNAIVEKMDSRDSDNYLAIATYGSGVFGAEVTSSKRIAIDTTSISEFDVQDISINTYPNPSSGIFRVSFDGQNSAFNSFRLFDELGRQKMNGTIPEFENEINIDASHLSAGVYYLTLANDETSSTNRVVINK